MQRERFALLVPVLPSTPSPLSRLVSLLHPLRKPVLGLSWNECPLNYPCGNVLMRLFNLLPIFLLKSILRSYLLAGLEISSLLGPLSYPSFGEDGFKPTSLRADCQSRSLPANPRLSMIMGSLKDRGLWLSMLLQSLVARGLWLSIIMQSFGERGLLQCLAGGVLGFSP